MLTKNYYSCYKNPIRNNCYTCKKFDNFFDADKHFLKNTGYNLNGKIIYVYKIIPVFLEPLYLRLNLIKYKLFDFRIRFEDTSN